MIVLKLGGSVLTDKATYKTLRADDLTRLAREVAPRAARSPLLVVHGAGSFGHVLARQAGLAEGARSAEAWRAASQVHADVRQLCAAVLAAFREAGAAPFAASPWTIAQFEHGRLARLDLRALLEAPPGALTVTFGDVVPDRSRGVGILSGDVLVREAALELRRRGEEAEVVFALAGDGVLDAEGRLVRRLARGAAVPSRGEAGADVTGGIVKKVEVAREAARAGCRVRFVNGLVAGRVADALDGKDVVGTEIEG